MTAFIIAVTFLLSAFVAWLTGEFNGVSVVVCLGALALIYAGIFGSVADDPYPDAQSSSEERIERRTR